ncbi:hypothetical protein GCM10010390_08200 [Streptomyces mordarskii]|uniref:Uncharacterized protein n=1 Tax=Streptomyces mordarskii TaxID=1226758 RepID=A0ABN1BXI5_9ACTN
MDTEPVQGTESRPLAFRRPFGARRGVRDAAGGAPISDAQPSRSGDSVRAMVKRVSERAARRSCGYRSMKFSTRTSSRGSGARSLLPLTWTSGLPRTAADAVGEWARTPGRQIARG